MIGRFRGRGLRRIINLILSRFTIVSCGRSDARFPQQSTLAFFFGLLFFLPFPLKLCECVLVFANNETPFSNVERLQTRVLQNRTGFCRITSLLRIVVLFVATISNGSLSVALIASVAVSLFAWRAQPILLILQPKFVCQSAFRSLAIPCVLLKCKN